MCGIFGVVAPQPAQPQDLGLLAEHAQQRGRDSSGLVVARSDGYHVDRADYAITQLLRDVRVGKTSMIMGHSRLITNGLSDNQPVVRDGIIVIHNGIVANHEEIWSTISRDRTLIVDTEVIAALAAEVLDAGGTVDDIPARVLGACKGVVACALAIPRLGKLVLFSNNGSLYIGKKDGGIRFASESFPLKEANCSDVRQVLDPVVVDIPLAEAVQVKDRKGRT